MMSLHGKFPRPHRRFAFEGVHQMDTPAEFSDPISQSETDHNGQMPFFESSTVDSGRPLSGTSDQFRAANTPSSGGHSARRLGSHDSAKTPSQDSLLALLRSLGSDGKKADFGAPHSAKNAPIPDASVPKQTSSKTVFPAASVQNPTSKVASLSSRLAVSTGRVPSKISSLSSLPKASKRTENPGSKAWSPPSLPGAAVERLGSKVTPMTGRKASLQCRKDSLESLWPAARLPPTRPGGESGGPIEKVKAKEKGKLSSDSQTRLPLGDSMDDDEGARRGSELTSPNARPTLLHGRSNLHPLESSFTVFDATSVPEDERCADTVSSTAAPGALSAGCWTAHKQEERSREERIFPLLTLPIQPVSLSDIQDTYKAFSKRTDPSTQGSTQGRALPWELAAAAEAQRDREAELENLSRAKFPLVSDVFSPEDKAAYLGMLNAYGNPGGRSRVLLTAPSSTLFVPPLHEDLECGEFRPAQDLNTEAAASLCRVFGPGLEHAEAGRLATFTIQAVNSDGTFMRSGDASFTVYVDPVKGSAAEQTGIRWKNEPDICAEEDYDSDAERLNQYRPPASRATHRRRKDTLDGYVYNHGDGTYTVHYYCTRAARHSIYVYLNDQILVGDSPYRVIVTPGSTDGENCEAYGDGTTFFALGGDFSEIVIQAKDAHGNKVKTGGDKFTVAASGAAKIVEITDMKDGTYWVKYYIPPGAERHFVEISISYHGRPIKGSPFRPRPGGPLEDEPPPARLCDTVNVANPSDSLMTLAEKCHQKWSQTKNPPALSPYPPFPASEEAEAILQRANLDYDAVVMDTTGEHLRETTKTLVQYSKDILNRDSTIQSVLKSLKAHGHVGNVYDAVEKGNRERLKQYLDVIAQLQAEMDVTYKSIHYGVVDSLPVALEVEDPREIREIHSKRRQALIQIHKNLEKKETELRQREARFKAQRLKFVSGMAEELERRREAVDMEKAALKENTQYILHLTQLSLKKHLRREMLIACEREPVEAFKSKFWQRDFNRMLVDTPALSEGKAKAGGGEGDDKDKETVEEYHPAPSIPDDPSRPSMWLHKGEFNSAGSTDFGIQKIKHDPNARLIRERRMYGGGNPTFVSYSLGSSPPPPNSSEVPKKEEAPGKRQAVQGHRASPSGSESDAEERPKQKDLKEETGRERVEMEDPRYPGFPFEDLPDELAIPYPRRPPPPPPPRYL
ncbi:Filamin/ABP280 repeat-containing protein [Toxoplasma gondii VAND]|uniref:Filamin/ABP280 repeat-containing protein n=1 Tax=Toxoplasma gondii VAND TaxID=933077 RepID=A0A086Q700_TOXGO|nr:Filamin/ABP280 repeat-containing protein [Toxoplasma gondii VAND]